MKRIVLIRGILWEREGVVLGFYIGMIVNSDFYTSE